MHARQTPSKGAPRDGIALTVRFAAARSVDLLQAIESTLDGVAGVRAVLVGVAEIAREVDQKLRAAPVDGEIDPDDLLGGQLEAAQDTCVRLLRHFEATAEAARHDPDLSADDGVADAYDRAAEAVRDAHDALGDVLFTLRQRDGIASGAAAGPFSDPAALVAFLRS